MEALTKMGDPLTEDEALEFVGLFDGDHDGTLNAVEFSDFMSRSGTVSP
jgi:Ca2+-binding EF-hand superfamily protein